MSTKASSANPSLRLHEVLEAERSVLTNHLGRSIPDWLAKLKDSPGIFSPLGN